MRVSSFLCCIVLVAATDAAAQGRGLSVDYTVKVADIQGQLFHVTTDIKNIDQPTLDVSLPTWTPGWYTIENYAKNVLRFRVSQPGGGRLQPRMVRKQTWRLDTKGLTRVTIDFDYQATALALNQARIASDFAFFTGTQLFLLPEGHRASPSVVRFDVPSGWSIASALKETADPTVFTAPDYDTLVDQPTEMGRFDVTRFAVEGKSHYLVANPAGVFSSEKAQKLVEHLTKVAAVDSKLFGGLPYEKYVYFYFFQRPETTASGALEHGNSFVAFVGAGAQAEPDAMVGQAAHEYFHLWNVKRIRPVQMWPYDYSRENETPLLWVSEGFTNYYAALTAYRAGLIDRQAFLGRVARAISGVENNEARQFVSPADSSTSTWIGYDTPVAFSISYYTQGQNLAALLDLSIRHDSQGSSGLDEVMRALLNDFYRRGRGFDRDDLVGVIDTLTRTSYQEFFTRYVAAVEIPDYQKIFGYAGYRVERSTQRVFDLGMALDQSENALKVARVRAGSTAAAAGLQAGDYLLGIDGRMDESTFRTLSRRLGEVVTLKIRRGGTEQSLSMTIGSRDDITYRIIEDAAATPEQLKVRDAWLRR